MGPEEQLAVQIQDMLRQCGQLTAQIQEALRQGGEETARELEEQLENLKEQLRVLKEQLWELLKPRVRILARRFRESAERVGLTEEDLMQEAYLKFDQVIERFDVGRGVKLWTWLETVLRNHFRDLLRRGEELPPLPPGPPPGPPAPPPIVDDVQSTVDTLLPDDPQRERKILAFKLYYKEGYTYQEIAEKLGIAVGTAHNWVKEVKEAFCEEFPKQRPEYF